MKTKSLALLIFLLIAVLLFPQQAEKKKFVNGSDSVYVNTGESEYHLRTCEKIGASYTGMPLMYALDKDYEPCPDCIPIKEVEVKVEADPGWRIVNKWSGKSIKDTESFQVSSKEWKITWDTKPGDLGDMNFSISVHKADGELVTIVANVIGNDKDSSIMRGEGSYYLSINKGQPYTITIQEKIR